MKYLIVCILITIPKVSLGLFNFGDFQQDVTLPVEEYSSEEPLFQIASSVIPIEMNVEIVGSGIAEPIFYMSLPTIGELAGGVSLTSYKWFSIKSTIENFAESLMSFADFYLAVEEYFSDYVPHYIEKLNKPSLTGGIELLSYYQILSGNETLSLVVAPRVLPMMKIKEYVDKNIDKFEIEGVTEEEKQNKLIEEARQLFVVYNEAIKIIKSGLIKGDISLERISDELKEKFPSFESEIKNTLAGIYITSDSFILNIYFVPKENSYLCSWSTRSNEVLFTKSITLTKKIFLIEYEISELFSLSSAVTGEGIATYKLTQTIWLEEEENEYKYKEKYYKYISQNEEVYVGGILLDEFKKEGDIIGARYCTLSIPQQQSCLADELLGNPVDYVAEYVQTISQKPDFIPVNVTITIPHLRERPPLVSFSEMEEGRDLSGYGGSTFFAPPPNLKIVKDEEKGKVLEFNYNIVHPSAVWFKARIDKILDPGKDKIKFSIKGLEEKPESIVVRLIKKDGSFAEVVIGEKEKLADLGYKGNNIELSISESWQDLEISLYMFIGEDYVWGHWPLRKRIKKFASMDEIRDVIAIAIVVRTDLNHIPAFKGGFRITDISL